MPTDHSFCRPWPVWSKFADAGIYCICLQGMDDRMDAALAELHKVGLCSVTQFYRPIKHETNPRQGSWEAHQAVARQAATRGKRALIMEDDVCFTKETTETHVESLFAEFLAVAANVDIFYFGHLPFLLCPVSSQIVRTLSCCIHCYLLDCQSDTGRWIQDTPYIPSKYGAGIDMYLATRASRQFAAYPMIALQTVAKKQIDKTRPLFLQFTAWVIKYFPFTAPVAERLLLVFLVLLASIGIAKISRF